jgi:hypothetical protein
VSEVVVGCGDAIDEVLEDYCEFLDQLLGFFGEREGSVVDRG